MMFAFAAASSSHLESVIDVAFGVLTLSFTFFVWYATWHMFFTPNDEGIKFRNWRKEYSLDYSDIQACAKGMKCQS